MAQQILPPIFRLCEPIDGLTSEQIASALGLDAAKFRSHSTDLPATQHDPFAAGPSDLARYADCTLLQVWCVGCNQTGSIRGLVSDGTDGASEPGDWRGAAGPLCCGGCGNRLEVWAIGNALTFGMRKHTKEYYTACLQCDEASCRATSRSISTHVKRDDAGLPLFPACTVSRCRGKMQKTRTDRALHTQLLYYASLFDETAARAKAAAAGKRCPEGWNEPPPLDVTDASALRSLLAKVRTELDASAFDRVDLAALFASV
jgi:DNA polymerase alpha subunit A